MARKAPPVRPLAKPSRSADDYTISALKNPAVWTEKELRAEYSRLRAIANKRIARLESSEFSGTAAQIIRYNKGKYVPLKDVASKEELTFLLKDVSKFVTSGSTTVSGQRGIRKKTIESLRAAGFEDIDESNYEEFGKFMEYMRSMEGDKFDSDRAVALYEFSARADISVNDLIANYKVYDEHFNEIDDMEEIPEPKSGKKITSQDVFDKLGIKEKKKKNISLDNQYKKIKSAAQSGAGWAKKPRKRV